MRRRLVVAILLLVAGTLLLAGAGGFVLIRRASANTAEQQLYTQAKALAEYQHPQVVFDKLGAVKYIGQYDTLTVVGLDAAGHLTGPLPAVTDGRYLDTTALSEGDSVGGHTSSEVYVLIPLDLGTAQKKRLAPPVPPTDTAVLVATRSFTPVTGGIVYFIVLGLGCLLVAGAVAYWLASRFSRPLVTAAETTGRIAGGDLDARMARSPRDMAEFASLAVAINAMGDRLREARQQQRQFLLSVSHELRTPLTSIRGYADAITEGATDDVAGAVEIIGTEARRLERLVQDLLDLARLDARRFSLRAGPVDAVEVASRAVERMRPEAASAEVELSLSTPEPGALPVITDPDRLDQVLSNLMENALRFARSRIAVGARREDGRVLLWVDDDGPGISPGDMERVFTPHFTSDRAGVRRAGTGLGLAIVAELATAMGGGARAESPLESGAGTRMVIWLPLAGPTDLATPEPGTE
ncbi:MAG: sensor histidine kinase [Acidimicrobiales bacterium]